MAKDATSYTRKVNRSLYEDPNLDWADEKDFENSHKGFIADMKDPVIENEEGRVVFDLRPYAFLEEKKAPPTVNPSLWRQSRLNMIHGLFKVTKGIYQVRGYDLSVMSIIESENGYIVIDPLVTAEPARACLDLFFQHFERRPIVAIIYTHSHIDHWGGVKGVVSEEDVSSGKVKIIAPEGFMEAALSENIMAGNAMSRRATYMYGNLLPRGPKGTVGTGLGQTTSNGTPALIPPTDTITETGTEMDIDGVRVVFQLTPDTEAPSEFNFYFPQMRALCMAENCTHTMHNLYTLRGAQVRDSISWSRYIDEAIELFAERTDVIFASHHWPTWGKKECREFLKRQRDVYKYLHDETLRLANHGYNMLEIAEIFTLPPTLAGAWYNRGYYGSVSHNVKAVYQKYLGWFDGNPANIEPLPPQEAGRRYVEYMGGAETILKLARKAYLKGDYRWVAQVVNHVVFADPKNKEARELEADALEQLGYQAESGVWRNFYLTGAMELRLGVRQMAVPKSVSPDIVATMSIESMLDLLAVRLNGPKASGRTIRIDLVLSDVKQRYSITVENGVLNYRAVKKAQKSDVTLRLKRSSLNKVITGEASVQDMMAAKEVSIKGDQTALGDLLSMLDDFPFWFNIAEP